MRSIIGKSLLFVLVGLISTIILLLLPPPPAAYATGGSFEIHQKGTAGGALNYVIIKDAVGSTPGEVSVIGSGRKQESPHSNHEECQSPSRSKFLFSCYLMMNIG